ncbi:MAG: RING finger protein [Desulfobacterales bacterium]|jgi:tetratricopeptide (TPR) repeat protein
MPANALEKNSDAVDRHADDSKLCVACREHIHAEAKLCPHCRSPQQPNPWKRVADGLKWIGGIAAVISLIIGVTQVNKILTNWKEKKGAVAELVEATKIRQASNDHEGAWNLIQEALELDPASEAARDVQVQLAMEWVRKTRIYWWIAPDERNEILKNIERLLPSLYRGAANKNTTPAADAMAHIGWADWIRQRAEMHHLNVRRQFERALEIDPQNMYANVMMGYWLVSKNNQKNRQEKIDKAMKHFDIALKSNRDRDYVRYWQFQTLLIGDREGEKLALQLANNLRKNQEDLNWSACREMLDFYRRLWSWQENPHTEKTLKFFLSSLPPAELLATYLWLNRKVDYEKNIRVLASYNIFIHKSIIARLTEESGDYAKALSLYQALISDLGKMELHKISESGAKQQFMRAIERVSQKMN